jgi:hypothetical protein
MCCRVGYGRRVLIKWIRCSLPDPRDRSGAAPDLATIDGHQFTLLPTCTVPSHDAKIRSIMNLGS